jgi:superfamily II DNA or RNA helicase
MLQTLARRKDDAVLGDYGLVIVDECHHVPAVSFESVLKRVSATHIVGLTATPFRKDGLQAIVHMQCGPVVHTMAEAQAQAKIARKVVVRETNFKPADTGAQLPIHEVWEALVADKERLAMVAADIVRSLERREFPLVLSDRVDHLELLLGQVTQALDQADGGFLVTSSMGKKMRRKLFDRINEMLAGGDRPFLLSTGSLIGEGFDLPELSTLFLAMPIAFKGRLMQYAGRIHRQSEGKSEVVVYDYVDSGFALGVSMFRKRVTAYRKMGYRFQLPDGSKLAGIVWPRGTTKATAKRQTGAQQDLPLFDPPSE